MIHSKLKEPTFKEYWELYVGSRFSRVVQIYVKYTSMAIYTSTATFFPFFSPPNNTIIMIIYDSITKPKPWQKQQMLFVDWDENMRTMTRKNFLIW